MTETLCASVTLDRIRSCLDAMDVFYGLDKYGSSLLCFINPFLISVRLIGDYPDFLVLETQFHRHASIAMRPLLDEQCQMANATLVAPKAFTAVSDDGIVSINAECSLPVVSGATDAQLDDFLKAAFSSFNAFFDQLAQTFPDTALWPESQES